jgi:hypothetical protein
VLGHFRENLTTSKLALEYLRERGIGDLEILQRFGVGYSDGKLGEI